MSFKSKKLKFIVFIIEFAWDWHFILFPCNITEDTDENDSENGNDFIENGINIKLLPISNFVIEFILVIPQSVDINWLWNAGNQFYTIKIIWCQINKFNDGW